MEELMQYVWQYRLWPVQEMVAVDGSRINVLDPGIHNRDAGPDFFNAKVQIGDRIWAGNVEIHVRASDWHRHGHDSDAAYDTVVLHVVAVDDMRITRKSGGEIPQMVMRCAPDFSERYNKIVNSPFRELPCAGTVAELPEVMLSDWLTALGFERLYAKADRIAQITEQYNGDVASALYITIARAMGFGTNAEPFEQLARATPLKIMYRYRDSLTRLEALLFGQAGLLEDTHGCEYAERLRSEYDFLRTKHSLTQSPNTMWKMSRMRPQNFPHRRISALAHLIYHGILYSYYDIIKANDIDSLRNLFRIYLEGFFSTHYNFTSEARTPSSTALSEASIDTLIINVAIPLIHANSRTDGDDSAQRAVEMLSAIRAENNNVVRTFRDAGFKIEDAFISQAAIQLRRCYCEPRKCLYCRIGHRLLSQRVKA